MALGDLGQYQPSFATLDAGVWTTFGSVTPIVRDGRLEVSSVVSGEVAGVETIDTGTLGTARVSVKMWRGGTAGAVSPRMRFRDAASGCGITVNLDETLVRLAYYDGTLTTPDGAPTFTASVTYSSSTHTWVGVRYDGTTIFLDTSDDGINWAQRTTLTPAATFTTNFNAANVHLSFITSFRTTADVAAFAKVNGAGPLTEVAANDTFSGAAGTLWDARTGEVGGVWRGGPAEFAPPSAQLLLSDAGRLRFAGSGDATGPVLFDPHYLLASAAPASADYDVVIRTRWVGAVDTGAGTKNYIMPLARGSWANEAGYTVTWDSETTPPALGIRAIGATGAVSTIGTDFPFTPTPDVDYEIRLRVSDNTVRLILDGVEVVSGGNTTFAGAGMPGLRAYTTTASASDTHGQHVDQFFVVPLGVPAPGLLAGALLETLTETFTGATIDATKWNTAVIGTPSAFGQAGSRLHFVGTSFGQSGLLISNKYYDAANSSLYARIYPIAFPGSSVNFRVVDAQGQGLSISLAATLSLGYCFPARRHHQVISLSYDAAAHAFIRFRVDADGTGHIDTAPEGADGAPGAWTSQLSVAQATQAFDASALRLDVSLNATTTGTFTVEADAVNAAVDAVGTLLGGRRRRAMNF